MRHPAVRCAGDPAAQQCVRRTIYGRCSCRRLRRCARIRKGVRHVVPWWHFICFVCPHSFIFYFSLFLFISSFFILFLCLFFFFLILYFIHLFYSGWVEYRRSENTTRLLGWISPQGSKRASSISPTSCGVASLMKVLSPLSPLSLSPLSLLSLPPLSLPCFFFLIFFCSYGLGHEVADGGSSFTIYNRASHGAPLDNGNKRRREGGRREEREKREEKKGEE